MIQIRRVQVKFHSASDFSIVYDFLQRVNCPLSRWSRQLSSKKVTSHSAEESTACEIRQPATQQTFPTVNSLEALGNIKDYSNNCSQMKSSQSQKPGEGLYDTQLSYNLNTRITDITARPDLHGAVSAQEVMVHGQLYNHSSQNHNANLATYPSTLHYNANAGTYDGLPSTAPPALNYSHQVGNDDHNFQMLEPSMPHGELSQYTAGAREFPNERRNEYQGDRVINDISASRGNGSPSLNSNKTYPPRRQLPWLRPRPHNSIADLPPLLTPQLASKVIKGKQNVAGGSNSSPIEKHITKSTRAPSAVTRRSQARSKIPVGKSSAKKINQKTCEKNSTGFKSSKGNKDEASCAKDPVAQKAQPPQASYKDASTETDHQRSTVDHMYSLLGCDSVQRAASNKATPALAAYARQTAGERAAMVNHMVAEVLYDPYFATLCNDVQTYVKDIGDSLE